MFIDDGDVLSIKGIQEAGCLLFNNPHQFYFADGVFKFDEQIAYLKKLGFDVWSHPQDDGTQVISAIPQGSPMSHAQWISECTTLLQGGNATAGYRVDKPDGQE